MRRLVATLAAAAAVLALAGCGGSATPPPTTVTVTAPPSASAAPTSNLSSKLTKLVTLPEVAGQNGAIVYDQLRALGLTTVHYASQDEEDKVVLDPANWTAVKIAPKAGSEVMSDQTVVVTMTKKK